MYFLSSDLYECDSCGFQDKWNAHDAHRGDIWECEKCMKHFCTRCFVRKRGQDAFERMLQSTDFVVCPECFENNALNVKSDAGLYKRIRSRIYGEVHGDCGVISRAHVRRLDTSAMIE